MISNTTNHAPNTGSIENKEGELKALLHRVMKEPLAESFKYQTMQLEERFNNIEDISKKISEESIPALQTKIRGHVEEMKKDIKRLRDEHVQLFDQGLASIRQEVMQLRLDHTLVKDTLGMIQQTQVTQGRSFADYFGKCDAQLNKTLSGLDLVGHYAKAAADDSSKSVTLVGESREQIEKTLSDIQANARTQSEQREIWEISQDKEQRNISVLIEEIASSFNLRLDTLKSNFENDLGTLQIHIERSYKEESDKSLSGLKEVGHYAKAAADESSKSVALVGESREQIEKTLSDIQANARTQSEQWEISLDKEQRNTSALIEEVALSINLRFDTLKSNFENDLRTLQIHIESSRKEELEQLGRDVKSRIIWLFGVTGMSLAGTIWMIAKGFF